MAILATRAAAGEASQAGVLAAVAYAEVMSDYCARKQSVLKSRTSAELLGFRMVKKSTEESMAEWQNPPAKPLWKRIVKYVAMAPLVLAALLVLVIWWLLTRIHR